MEQQHYITKPGGMIEKPHQVGILRQHRLDTIVPSEVSQLVIRFVPVELKQQMNTQRQ